MELYDGLQRLRERHRISNSQLVVQALWALLRGAIEIRPARSPYLIGLETYALRAGIAQAEEHAAREAWEARAASGTCACCSERVQVAPVPLEPGGPEYPLCWPCTWPVERPANRRKRAHA